MRKRTKIWLVIATFLMLVGGMIFAVVMTMLGWDFMKISTVKYETNHYEIGEEFENISIQTNTTDVIVVLSDNEKCEVKCYEEQLATHSVAVKDNTLTVEVNNEKSVWDHVEVNFGSPKITVYIPKEFTIQNVDIELSTGDVTVKDINCKGNMAIRVSTGDVYIEKSDASEIFIKTSTGDVIGSFLTEKVYTAKTNTGEIDVPKSKNGGKCEIRTSTGDIIIK